MHQDSIYTIALKYGADNTHYGITYNKLLTYLKSKNIKIDHDFQRYFHVWFYENFYVAKIYPRIKNFEWRDDSLSEKVISQCDDDKAIITGSAHQAYLEYEELKQAYKSSKQASIIAISSIIIAIIIGLTQILISIN